MQKSGFFNSINKDRVYSAIDFSRLFYKMFNNGIFVEENNDTFLQVTPLTGYNVRVREGMAFIDGHWFDLTESEQVQIPNSNGVYAVCVTLDNTERKISLQVVKQSQPRRTGNYYDLVIALITVNGEGTIVSSMISDKRKDSNMCGIVYTSYSTIKDFRDLNNSLQQNINDVKSIINKNRKEDQDWIREVQTDSNRANERQDGQLEDIHSTLQDHGTSISGIQGYLNGALVIELNDIKRRLSNLEDRVSRI